MENQTISEQNTTPIADIHCDLLCYLQGDPVRSACDPASRCALPQLRAGHVQLQVLAIFTETAVDSLQKGIEQATIYKALPTKHPQDFIHGLSNAIDKISLLYAFENASSFCSEDEPLEKGLKRLSGIFQEIGNPLYISLTWNSENRFGGGAHTDIGLKDDGRQLLEKLDRTGIAVDLSHTSDRLAYDLIEEIDKKGFDIPIIASHSNCRTVLNLPRNLPDALIREIIHRQGIIGLNLYSKFVGPDTQTYLIRHLTHLLELGAAHSIAFGADFFYDLDLPISSRHAGELFSAQFPNSACYGSLLKLFKSTLALEESTLKALAHGNVTAFIQNKTKI